MAYSGSGTQADPYIVDNWADFVTVLNLRYDIYIKWADKENEAEKTISSVTIDSSITWKAKYVDFNQWTFNYIRVNVNFTGQTSIFSIGPTNVQIRNWHVKVWSIKDFRCMMHYSTSLNVYSCFYDSIQCDELPESSDYWTNTQGYALPQLFVYGKMHECILKIDTQGRSMIVPKGDFENCEIWINYKYTQTTGTTAIRSKNSIFQNTYLTNSFIGGTIDVSEGVGSFAINNPKKTGTPSRYPICLQMDNSIVNLQFIIGENCYINQYGSEKVITYNTESNRKSYFVVDNGNNLSNFDKVPEEFRCALSDIKDPQQLLDDDFPYIEDNNVRYPQYSYDRSGENWIWHQVDDVNNAIPFLPFWYYPTRLIPRYDTDRGYICVYDISEPQNGYEHNGLAVLSPSEIISTKEDKGRWDIEIVHPIDRWGKWSYIVGQNVVKVNGQLFRIDDVETYLDADSEYVTAHAKHITYDMSDVWINEANFTANGGTDYYIKLYASRVRDFPNQQHIVGEYIFNVTSDIAGTMECALEDQSLTEALFGADNSFINRYGGELYRDNFNITINQRLEGADNAFSIRYGTDLTKISFKIDFSQWITNLICEDNHGNLWGVWYDTSGDWIVHHHKTKRIHFTYNTDDANEAMSMLISDGQNYWATYSTPIISIEIKVAAIKNDPKYKDFLNLQNFDVGYSGQIYVEHLGIDVSMKIVSIRRNELTGEAISITLGNSRGSLIRQTVLSQTIVPNNSIESKQEAAIAQVQQELFDTNTKIMSQSIANMEEFAISDIEKRSIAQLEGLI